MQGPVDTVHDELILIGFCQHQWLRIHCGGPGVVNEVWGVHNRSVTDK